MRVRVEWVGWGGARRVSTYRARVRVGTLPTSTVGTYSSGEPRRYILSVQTDSSFKLTLGLVDVC